jgi:putative NAD(P)H quinone oxidoreductase, PIG3 family
MQRQGHYPAPPGAPAEIPGLEYSGEVDAVGAGVTMWNPGDRVMGLVGGGAHAEYCVTHEREAIAMPRDAIFEQAAAIPEAFITAYDALFNQLDVRLGERVLIHAAASGVGTAAVQLAHAAGMTVFGTSRSLAKLERARPLGLDHAIDSSRDGWIADIEERTERRGVHAIVDLVGGDYLAANLRLLAARGRLVIVGLTAGRKTELDMGMLLAKRLRVVGTVLRARPLEEKIALARDFATRIVPMFDAARLQPVVDRVLPFAAIAEAHELVERNATFGKVVVRWE